MSKYHVVFYLVFHGDVIWYVMWYIIMWCNLVCYIVRHHEVTRMKYSGQKVVVHIPQKNYWKKGLSVSATASEICSIGEKITVDDLYKQVVPGVKFRDTLKLRARPSGGHS